MGTKAVDVGKIIFTIIPGRQRKNIGLFAADCEVRLLLSFAMMPINFVMKASLNKRHQT